MVHSIFKGLAEGNGSEYNLYNGLRKGIQTRQMDRMQGFAQRKPRYE